MGDVRSVGVSAAANFAAFQGTPHELDKRIVHTLGSTTVGSVPSNGPKETVGT
jgi:hypothetical protein